MSQRNIIRNRGGLLAIAALLSGSLAGVARAQNRAVPRMAPERAFSITPNVETPMVLKTEPDAECSLHPAGVSDSARTMKLYANADGYVRVHLTAKAESQESNLELDCITAGAITTHPIHLRTGASPTEDMPAPDATLPTPKGAQVLPALTEEAARQLSDTDVISLGYPPRPDLTGAPGAYAAWLDVVSRPMALLPTHPASRNDISHQRSAIQDITAEGSSNWSGVELRGPAETYVETTANWIVPPIFAGENGYNTYSSLWIGLDGDGLGDLVQDGTESDSSDFGGVLATSYYAWTEVLPLQPTAQQQFTVNPGDEMNVQAWIGDSSGNINFSGGYAWFYIADVNQGQATRVSVQLDYFWGKEAEWIMERPEVGGALPELSHYAYALVRNAAAYDNTTGKWITSSAARRKITMYENDNPHSDNNELSSAALSGSKDINFTWAHFH